MELLYILITILLSFNLITGVFIMSQLDDLKSVLDGALSALQDMEVRVDALITALSNIPTPPTPEDLSGVIAEAQSIKDMLAAFHAANPTPAPVPTPDPVVDPVPPTDPAPEA
jgi:hypothetical protein